MFTVDENFHCLYSKRQYKHERVICTCRKNEAGSLVVRFSKKHRSRSDEEYVVVTVICQSCEHFNELDFLCDIQKKGCSGCRTSAAFAKFKRSGRPCPDKRFSATELVDLSTEPKSD